MTPWNPADHHRIDAVLPLVARDHKRFERLLLPSLQHYFEALGTCWVVVPAGEKKALRRRIDDARFAVVTEEKVLPELRHARARHAARGKPISGWMIQQLLKLSMARRVTTPFYLTLDADVVCVKPIRYEALVDAGRGIANVTNENPQARPDTPHAQWYRRSAQLLGMPSPRRTHGVTPAVLSRDAVLELFAFLEERAGARRRRAEAYLLEHLAWTEYTLYYTFLERQGLFDTYHFPARATTYGNNIWQRWDAEAWDPAIGFAAESDFSFSVLQSNNPACKVKTIVKRIRSHFKEIGQPSPF